jgi:hypothetical protein
MFMFTVQKPSFLEGRPNLKMAIQKTASGEASVV